MKRQDTFKLSDGEHIARHPNQPIISAKFGYLEAANDSNHNMHAKVRELTAEVEAAKAENARLAAERDSEHSNVIKWMVRASDWCENYKAEKAKLEQENARLVAALLEIAKGEGPFSRDPLTHAANTIEHATNTAKGALKGDSTALRDLLGTTVELLRDVRDWSIVIAPKLTARIEEEINRINKLIQRS